jgi:hypothetical protein
MEMAFHCTVLEKYLSGRTLRALSCAHSALDFDPASARFKYILSISHLPRTPAQLLAASFQHIFPTLAVTNDVDGRHSEGSKGFHPLILVMPST